MRRLGYYVVGPALAAALVLSACAAPQNLAPAPQKPAAASPAPMPQLTREQKLIEGAKKEGEINFWVTSIGEQEKLIGLFEAKYPFLKLKIHDTLGSEAAVRLAEEAKVGRRSADVLIPTSSDLPNLHIVGLTEEYEFPNTVGWPNQPKHKYYAAWGSVGLAVLYNTNLVSPAEAPKSWDDVKSSRWAGKTLMSNAGTNVPLLWAYLWRENDKLNWDRSFAFWAEVIRNTRPRVASGYSGPTERLAAGEASLFTPASTTGTIRMIAQGAPIGIAPLPVPGTTMGISLVKNAPHPNASRLFLDWFTSPEGLLAYANPSMYFVIAPEAREKAQANRRIGSMGVDFDVLPAEVITLENMKKSSEFWLRTLGLK